MTLVIRGETQTIPLKPGGLMAAERKFGANAFEDHAIESSLFACWVSLGKPGDFEQWVDGVDELVTPDDGQDPTLATPSEASLPSPSPPV